MGKYQCIFCQKPTLLRKLCFSCRQKVPSGYSFHNSDEDLISVIKCNEQAKAEFRQTTSIGTLRLDTENGIFHIDNGYYRIRQLTGYSFYNSEPRFKYGLFGRFSVVSDVYFSFTIIGQERRIRRIKLAVPCKYENTGTAVSVEPPACMQMAKHTFADMLEKEMQQIERELRFMKSVQK